MLKQALRKAGVLAVFVQALLLQPTLAQVGPGTQWTKDGYAYMHVQQDEIVQTDLRDPSKEVTLVSKAMLTPQGQTAPIKVRRFSFSDDGNKVLIQTNTKKVWRYDTRGDFWVYDINAKSFKQLGKDRPASSLMFAKFSPDGTRVAYVSEHNLFVEDLAAGTNKALTTDGTDKLINGTFDWVYEEELDCRDGFRWSPDGKSLAYWQLDATKTKNYLMLNTTDALYPFTVPVEYPVVGEDPSRCRIGVVPAQGGATKWMDVPGDAVQHYIPRMEWAANSNELIIQQLNRRQNESKIILCTASTGASKAISTETDKAWIDAKAEAVGWNWIEGGKRFLWLSEKDGWRHIYALSRGGQEKLLTKGNYDVISLEAFNEKEGVIYFMASPENATQTYLYKVALKGGNAERVTPKDLAGTNGYDISPNGRIALHTFSNSSTYPVSDVVSLPEHKRLNGGETPAQARSLKLPKPEFFQVKTVDGITMDGWMVKPTNFDATKKYPIVFYVYGEPASQTVTDRFGTGANRLYNGSMADDGYIYVSVENRGAPAPKGREWRKSVYHKLGQLNIRDQAMAAKEILKRPYVDTTRVAVWGWSGGGSSTLNLLFQYPQIYKTGISIAAVDNQLNYDNIYQERYMGLLPEDRDYFVKGSPLNYAQNLRGHLLLIHGTGDDNVHYNNAEQMINALIANNKPFQLMAYPNRTHSISEGEGTSRHLATTYTQFLKEHCPPGAR
ncbi:S9 family peptidase [Hymenobacter jejuensis]|uniref:S9 family peptidase n=1 Tax=Hymenobacter jejuensis TaxID=2502781 RepID=A0A5B8A5H1_9BACT|nr:S9 family peptidase [Hymenobacter jejuensis]QDA61452.1 S9 family peptidase [Hymenobacter jejuensis]